MFLWGVSNAPFCSLWFPHCSGFLPQVKTKNQIRRLPMQLAEEIFEIDQNLWSGKNKAHLAVDKLLYRSGVSAVGLLSQVFLNMDIVGQERIPAGPKILAANHPTTVDPFLLLTLVKDEMSIMVTGGAFTIPLFGRYLQRVGHIPVVGGDGRAAMAKAEESLAGGRSLGIFPEGALSPDGGLHPPHTGVARLALLSGVPVIPIGIHPPMDHIRQVPATINGERAFGRIFLRGRYVMTVGSPLNFSGSASSRKEVQTISSEIMKAIVGLRRLSIERSKAYKRPFLKQRSRNWSRGRSEKGIKWSAPGIS
jgi:1-acyl-sn-glycerol-3-phosphate acyltransferase